MKRAADTLHFAKEDQSIELCDECKTQVLEVMHSPDDIIGFDNMPRLIMTLTDQVMELQDKLALMENSFEPPKKKRGRPKKSNSQATH